MPRECSKCGPTEAEFPKVGAVCKPCVALYKQTYYKANKSRINKKSAENYRQNYERYSAHAKARYRENSEPAKERVRASRAERKRIIDEAKSRLCADCKNTFPVVCMDFDHRPGVEKVACVGQLNAWGAPIEIILEEIAKCDVVCSNCHRIRTEQRRKMV